MIIEYTAGRVATIDRVWDVNPAGDSEYQIVAFSGILLANHGVAQAGAASTITLATSALAIANSYVGCDIYIAAGTGAGQTRLITAYTAGRVATVSPAWDTQPDNTSAYKVLPVGRSIVENLPVATQASIDAIEADTNELQTDWTDGGRLDLLIDAILADTGTDGVLVAPGAITAAVIADNAIDDASIAADVDTYQAKVWLIDDDAGATDRYVAAWFLNAEPVTAGITSPTIRVIAAADGSDLVASTAMVQVGATGLYRHDEATNRVSSGATYFAMVQATIGGATRTWYQPVGRDSTA
jgi:hypothetical protein